MRKETVRKIGRALETGGLSLVFERGKIPPVVERPEPTTRLGRFTEVLATGGYSLLDRQVEVVRTPVEATNEVQPDTAEE